MEKELKNWEKKQQREHFDKYATIAEKIGLDACRRLVLVVASKEQLDSAHAKDQHLNTIQLKRWDAQHPTFARLARTAKVPDASALFVCTCVLKVVARHFVLDVPPPPAEWAQLTDEQCRD